MKEEKLFNPLPLPSDLPLASVAAPAAEAPAATKRKARSQPKPRNLEPNTRRLRPIKPRLTLQQIKARVHTRLAGLNPAQLKRVLLACGLGVAVVAFIVLMAKFAPVMLLLILVLGVTGLAGLYNRLRPVPGPGW